MHTFQRGYIIHAHVPKAIHTADTPPPSFFLYGEHDFIMLHDSDFEDIDPRMALAVPITSATAEVKKAIKENRDLLASYIFLNQEEYSFLDHDSYISTSQIMPINRSWLVDFKDQVSESDMAKLDLQVIVNLGLMETVMGIAQKLYEGRLNRQVAATSEEEESAG